MQAIYLGYTVDQCSGVLKVRNRHDQWVTIPRGQRTKVDVAIDGDGWWRWRCGSTEERSRGSPNHRQRVKRLQVTHSTEGRRIVWALYDLLP